MANNRNTDGPVGDFGNPNWLNNLGTFAWDSTKAVGNFGKNAVVGGFNWMTTGTNDYKARQQAITDKYTSNPISAPNLNMSDLEATYGKQGAQVELERRQDRFEQRQLNQDIAQTYEKDQLARENAMAWQNKMGAINTVVSAGTAIYDVWSSYQQLKLAREQQATTKKAYEKNYNMQVQDFNRKLEARGAYNQAMGASKASADAYVEKNKAKKWDE